MRIALLLAATAAALVSQAASAQDTTTTFRGFRIEGNIGGDRYQSEGVHNNKLGFGATAGFDGMIGNKIVVGPEVSYWQANNWSEDCTAGAIGGSVCHKSFEELGIAARVGYLVTPQLLVFAKGGYVANDQRKRFDAPATETSFYNHGGSDGYQVGGGAEYTIGNRFSGALSGLYVNAQYVYSQYDDHSARQRAMAGVGIRFR